MSVSTYIPTTVQEGSLFFILSPAFIACRFSDDSHSEWCEVMLFFSWAVLSDSLQPHELQHTRPHCSSLSLGLCSNTCLLSHWCQSAISSSVTPYSSCPQSFPESGSFPMSCLSASGSQITGASASASVLPVNIQGWFPLGLTGLISLEAKRLSKVFSSTAVWKHPFFSAQLSLWSHPHIHTWLLAKP